MSWGGCLPSEEGMSGMVFRMVPTIRKEALRDIITGMSIIRGDDSSVDNGEEGDAG